MGKIFFFFAILLSAIIFSSGCIFLSEPAQLQKINSPAQYCIELCQAEKEKGTDFSNGPCLGNPIAQAQDFVCDIAHSPRMAIDDLQENQCSSFREGKASHFIELNELCELIKKY